MFGQKLACLGGFPVSCAMAMTKLFEAMEAALGQERTSYEWTLAFTLAQIPVVLFVLASTGGFVLVRKLPQWLWRCCRCLCFRKNQEGDSKLKELQNQYRMQIAKSAAALGLLLSAAYRLYQLANGTQDERIHRDAILLAWEIVLLAVLLLILCGKMAWRWMNSAYFLLMLILASTVLPGMIGPANLVIAMSMTWLLRCSILPLTNSVELVLVSNLICHVCMRVSTARMLEMIPGGQSAVWRQRVEFYIRFVDNSLAIDTVLSLLSCLASIWLEHTTSSIVEKSLEAAMLKNEARACESLLATFCEAHLFLDSQLRLVKNVPNLASMLFRANNNAGTDFMQCLATADDKERFIEGVNRPDVERPFLAQAMHLALRDGYGNTVPVECFHVKTVDGHGEIRHLVGLREETEAKMVSSASAPPSSPTFHKSLSETSDSSGHPDRDDSGQAFLIFDAAELDIMGVSANFVDATGLNISDGAKFSDLVDFNVDFQRRLAKTIGQAGRQAASEDLENPPPAAHFRTKLQMKMRNGGVTKSRWKFNVQKHVNGQLIVQGILLKTGESQAKEANLAECLHGRVKQSGTVVVTPDVGHATSALREPRRNVDIGWRVLMQSWIETAPERLQDCGEQLKGLFEANIDQCWEMCQRKIKTPVPVTQNWLVCSLLKLLMALLRCELPLDPEKDKQDLPMKEKEVKVENMFWLALVWSFGATTDSAGRKIMNSFIRSIQQGMPVKEEFDLIADDPTMRPVTKTPFPEKDTVYEYFAFAQSNKWENWTKKITGFDIPKEALAHQVMVPTADTVRSAFLLQSLVASEYHILYSGLTGTGKTVVIQQELLKRFDKDKYTVISFAFSAQTNANQTQDIIDGKLDKRKKGTYGPPFGKKCLLFIDDLNMPAKEKYGAQPPIELLRQWMDTQGWYERKTAEFRNLVDLIFIGAMGPPGAGRPFLTGRFQRHFNLVFVTPFEQESLQRIFQTIMQWFLGRFPGAVAGVANAVVRSTIQLYEDMSAAMLPTPAKSHYTFNLRDLAKVHLGICRCQKKSMESADDLARCWAHEAHRVFFDRLVTKDDQTWFREKMSEILKENFKKDWKSLVKVEPLIWCDFIDPRASHYQQVEEPDQLVQVLDNFLMEYNSMAKRGMELVLFMAAAQHVSQVVRVLKTPLGNALLVGVGGSGRKSLATLAAFVAEQETFQIEITKSYGMNDWHEDIKRLLIRCGGQMKEASFWAVATRAQVGGRQTFLVSQPHI
eukprot:s53_g15.t1